MRLAIADAAGAAEPGRLSQFVGWLTDIQRILGEADAAKGEKLAGVGGGAAVAKELPRVTPSKEHERGRKRYPQFFRDGEALVKVGWSRKSREEYEHKAPKAAVLAVAGALAEAGRAKRRITMEKVMPVRDAASNTTVPDYQVYVTLAWLRELNVVVQHGRQGYTFAGNGDLQQLIGTSWDSLASR
jgi:hypothetical protein